MLTCFNGTSWKFRNLKCCFAMCRPTFCEIIKKKSSGSYSGVPYACTLGNCLLWVFYGLPIITQNNILVITINGFGVGLESLYLLIFILCSKGKVRVRIHLIMNVNARLPPSLLLLTSNTIEI